MTEEAISLKTTFELPIQFLAKTAQWFGANPITLREFIRHSRSVRFWLLMALLLIIGSTILCMVWSYSQLEDPIIPIGRRLFYALLAAELAVVVLFLPGVVSHSLISERDQDTYPLLLTTPLGPGRIISGKLISTLGVMVLLVVSTFPLIGVCLARGGVSPFEMIAGSFGLIFASFVVASFSIYHALNAKTTLNAILMTHITLFFAVIIGGATLAFWLGILYSFLGIFMNLTSANNPILAFLQTNFHYIWIWNFAIMSLLLAFWVSCWMLRSSRSRIRFVEPEIRPPWVTKRFRRSLFWNKGNQKENAEESWWDYEDNMNPFYIRERLSYAVLSSFSSVSSWYVVILLCHVLFLLTPISGGKWVAILILLAIGQMAPAYAGPLFAREKENDTWDLVLTTVCRAQGILHGKLKGALSQCLPRAAALLLLPFVSASVLVYLIQFLSPSVKPLFAYSQVFFYGVILFVQLFFILNATAFISMRVSRAGQAISAGYAIMSIVYAFPYLLGLAAERFQFPTASENVLFLSPIYMIHRIPAIFHSSANAPLLLFAHIGLYAAASVLFYALCALSLRRLR